MKTSVNQLASLIFFLTVFSQPASLLAGNVDAKFIVIENADSETLRVNEKYSSEFLRDPVGFINDNFDPTVLPIHRDKTKYEYYEVYFTCSKGVAKAKFNKNWKLDKTHIQLENVLLPMEARRTILKDYPGWEMISNRQSTVASRDKIKTVYKITLKHGNQKKRIKIS